MFLDKLREEESGKVTVQRIRPMDRLHFALLFSGENIYAAYMASQNCLSRPEVDAGEPQVGGTFWTMAVEMLNNREWEPSIGPLPTLHSDFVEAITCVREDYEWTIEKGKNYLNEVRRHLADMIRRYEISGNGANQATHDDSDNKLDEDEEHWGRFNAERAQRVALRRNETSNGDDRSAYLRHLPPDYLYTWDELDSHDLLHFTCAQLSVTQSANSHTTPTPTARTKGKKSTLSASDQLVRNQRKLMGTVRDIGVSIAEMSKSNAEIGRAAKIRRIDDLRATRYRAAIANAATASSTEAVMHHDYIEVLTKEIDAATAELSSSERVDDGASTFSS